MQPLDSKNLTNFIFMSITIIYLDLNWYLPCNQGTCSFLYYLRAEEKEATPVPDSGTLVIGMRGPEPRAVIRVSWSGSFCIRLTCTIKAFVVSRIEPSTYLLLINWRRAFDVDKKDKNRVTALVFFLHSWFRLIYVVVVKTSKKYASRLETIKFLLSSCLHSAIYNVATILCYLWPRSLRTQTSDN